MVRWDLLLGLFPQALPPLPLGKNNALVTPEFTDVGVLKKMKVVKLTRSGVPNYTKARPNGLKVERKAECWPTSRQVRKQLTLKGDTHACFVRTRSKGSSAIELRASVRPQELSEVLEDLLGSKATLIVTLISDLARYRRDAGGIEASSFQISEVVSAQEPEQCIWELTTYHSVFPSLSDGATSLCVLHFRVVCRWIC